jgi:hypothetical protein
MQLYRARWVLGVLGAVACKASPPAPEAPPVASVGQGGAAATPLIAPGMQANENTAGGAAFVERPSTTDNMARSFQGALKLRVSGEGGEHGLRFFASGNKARIQIDGVHGKNFDALVWDDNISMIDHDRKSYSTVALAGLKAADEAKSSVERKSAGERRTLQGVVCEPYELVQGPYVIDACTSGVPGDFQVDEFETVSGLDVPPWAESLLKDHLLPIQATVKRDGREVYRVELMEYSPPPVAAATLAIPAGYQQRDPQRAPSR